MKHYIIKSITLSYLCVIIFCTLSSCIANDQNTSNKISTETEADFEETAVFSETIKNTTLDLNLTIPEHWKDIAVVTGYSENCDNTQTGNAIAFTLYEKSAYSENSTGLVWDIQAYPLDIELTYKLENVKTVNGSLVIGTDTTYRYLLYLPTDVQYLCGNKDSKANYTQLHEESRSVIEGFLEENYITANEQLIKLFADNTASEIQKIPEVSDTLLNMLIENVKSMQPVMKWFVYGCDVIGFEQDIQYLTDNGTYYFRINDPEFSEAGIKSLESLRNYLRQFFTAEYTENIMEKYSQKFLEADGELYILAASAAPSALYTVESASAVYICDNEIKLTFDAAYKLFNAEPQPTALEFTFILEDGKWLCSSSPDFFSCVKIYLDE